ncbi:MAG TPA: cupin domain-containing protein [Steroidobacteraceae bacterium]|nr:cupin domain-containing protein [Steroidobacteraceae bacterium]
MQAKDVIRGFSLSAVVALAAVTVPAGADAPPVDPAVSRNSGDTGLAWGPCPDFLPAGCAIAVLHGDPSRPNADVFFRVPARAEIPLHSHTSAERMVLVAGELEVAYEGQAPVRLSPGAYAYGPPGRPHAGHCMSDVPCILFIAFESAVDAMPAATAGH